MARWQAARLHHGRTSNSLEAPKRENTEEKATRQKHTMLMNVRIRKSPRKVVVPFCMHCVLGASVVNHPNSVPAVGLEPTPSRLQRDARPSSCTGVASSQCWCRTNLTEVQSPSPLRGPGQRNICKLRASGGTRTHASRLTRAAGRSAAHRHGITPGRN
jgi:hypothetical protein